MTQPIVGVLALQGDFALHIDVLNEIGVVCREVRTPEDLKGLHALILPGGESTSQRKLMKRNGLWDQLLELREKRFPMFGTCAGLILMAREIQGGRPDEDTLGCLDITVTRNAYGRQRESFVARLNIKIDLLAHKGSTIPEESGSEPAKFSSGESPKRASYDREMRFSSDGGVVLDGIFIRAPIIVSVSAGVRILADHNGKPVFVASDFAMGTTFHPEAVPTSVIHRWFLREYVIPGT